MHYSPTYGDGSEEQGRGLAVRLRSSWQSIYALTLIFLLAFVSVRLFPDLPLGHSFAASTLGSPLALIAVFAAWRASRRAPAGSRLRRAWIWVALALAGQAGGDLTELGFEAAGVEPGYPSLAEALYLTFYPLLLIGILSFPALQRSARQSAELALDCAIVGLGGGAAFCYFVLGPQILEGSSALEAAVTIAYPVGDMILLVALAAAVMGNPLPSVRSSLSWMTAAVGLFILGDLIFGYLILHGDYEPSSLLNIAYQLAFACFIVAGTKQRSSGEEPTRAVAPEGTRASWLPYLAIAAAIAILVRSESGQPLFPDVALSMITAMVLVLIVARQLISLVDLRQSRARLSEAQALAQLGSWSLDLERNRIELSDVGAKLIGLDPGDTLSFEEAVAIIHPDDRPAFEGVIERAVSDSRPFAIELRVNRSDGECRTFLSRADAEMKDGEVVRLNGTHLDITDRKRMEAQLEYQADHDPLTGLYNRRHFSEELERGLRFARRYSRSGAVLMIDVDNFKTVNDTHGHAAGDSVLKGLSAAISAETRETDLVARLGGDEFAVVLPEATVAEAKEAAEQIRGRVSETSGGPSLTIGIAPFDGAEELVADDVLVAADIALYEAKQAGKNQVHVFNGRTSGAISWVERIREALDEGRLVLYAQPMLDLDSGRVSHKELLIRMLGEDGELIPPSAFLPTAERVGLIGEIDRWVTEEGLRLASRGERVSINLSAPSIGDAEIMAMVRAAIADGVRPGDLIFEITETAAMTNMDAAAVFVGELTDLGCGVALDDFGTGFGSFTYLKHLPASYLKIDIEFIRDVVANSTDREVVRSITDVAHSLGKRTVAEGVENQETLAAVRGYGVDCAQGFFVGPPERISPPTQFEESQPASAIQRARAGE